MANIRISAINIEVDKKILEEYSAYINTADEKVRQSKQRFLEETMAPLYGARRISGNPRLIPDYYVDPDELLEGIAPFFGREDTGRLNIEAKFQRKSSESSTSTTIGGSVFKSVLDEIQESRPSIQSTEGLFKYLDTRLKSGSVFDWLKSNAPNFHAKAYNKAKNLTIFTKAEGSVLAYQIYFPISKFNSNIFGTTYYSNKSASSFTFSYYLNNSFEKSMIAAVQKSIYTTSIKGFKDLEFEKLKTVKVSYGKGGGKTQQVDIYWPHTNSIPVANINTKIPRIKKPVRKAISAIDWTRLVRGRVKLRMRRGVGNPRPPKIYERSGTFRLGSSPLKGIQVVEGIKDNTLDYFYIPYYASLEKYGYDITELVEGSIRAVAQERLGRQFLLRRNLEPLF